MTILRASTLTLNQVKARLIPDPRERDRKSKEQMFKTVCDVAKDLTVSAIRGAQVMKISVLGTFLESQIYLFHIH